MTTVLGLTVSVGVINTDYSNGGMILSTEMRFLLTTEMGLIMSTGIGKIVTTGMELILTPGKGIDSDYANVD